MSVILDALARARKDPDAGTPASRGSSLDPSRVLDMADAQDAEPGAAAAHAAGAAAARGLPAPPPIVDSVAPSPSPAGGAAPAAIRATGMVVTVAACVVATFVLCLGAFYLLAVYVGVMPGPTMSAMRAGGAGAAAAVPAGVAAVAPVGIGVNATPAPPAITPTPPPPPPTPAPAPAPAATPLPTPAQTPAAADSLPLEVVLTNTLPPPVAAASVPINIGLPPPVTEAGPVITVGAILCDGSNCTAMLNRRPSKVGDRVQGYTVASITADEVILKAPGKATVTLHPPQ